MDQNPEKSDTKINFDKDSITIDANSIGPEILEKLVEMVKKNKNKISDSEEDNPVHHEFIARPDVFIFKNRK